MVARLSSFFRIAPSLSPAHLGLLALLGAGCLEESSPTGAPGAPASPKEAPAPRPAAERARGEAAPSAGERPYDSSQFGAVHGTILYPGPAPERFVLGAAASNECKHHPEVDQRANVVVVADGKLANVFVHIDSGYDPTAIPAAPEGSVTLDQKGCMYVPRVLGLRVGQKLLVTNEDPTAHNVHTRSKRNPGVNRTMGAKQAPLEFLFEKPELPIPFVCDIHPWMGAAVFVEEHPWFAVSDDAGVFQIRDVPPGRYEVEAIHETLGKVSGTVEVKAGVSSGIALTLGKR